MAEETISPPPPTTEKPSFGEWVSEHKGIVIGGAIVVGLGIYLIMKHSKGSSANASATSGPQGSAGGSPIYEVVPGGGGYGGDNQSYLGANALSSLIQSYEQLVQSGLVPNPAGSGTTSTGGTSTVTSGNQGVSALNGSQILGEPLSASTQVTAVGSFPEETALLQSGQPLYFNSGGGYFPAAELVPGSSGPAGPYQTIVAPGTQLFVKNP